MMRRCLFLALAVLAFAPLAMAVDDPSEMLPDRAAEARAEAIGAQLRCLVCQNESIEDSSAPLARDLRRVVREHVKAGESNAAIVAWMTQRYGDFIRLRPRLTLQTALLWAMPALALLIGLALALTSFRRKPQPVPLLSADEQARIDVLSGHRP